MTKQILLSWSGGKDSMLVLHKLAASHDYEVQALVCHVDETTQKVSVHGVPRQLLEQQAQALNLPLKVVELPPSPSNTVYEERIAAALEPYRIQGIDTLAYGDLFLEDIRQYREQMLAKMGMQGLYPIWRENTRSLSQQFIELGFKARVVCVDLSQLSSTFAGRGFDEKFLADLPANVDPCGENGEFHTFVFDGPLFAAPMHVEIGKPFVRDNRFYHCEIQ
ncbi:MAG: diphthine--ammonia ligase [Anaerolineaceae bacterium]|nr:diphthine--ammonia ligase [Anaerolineaceae bacterium]